MQKKFKKLANIILVLTVALSQLIPSIQVFASVLTEEVGLVTSIKTGIDEYVDIKDEYTFNYDGTDITNYDIKVKTNNYTLEGNNYLLVLDNDVYTINYDKVLINNSARYVLSKGTNDYVEKNINLTALNFNGKMNLKFKLYEIDDMYDEFILGGSDVSSIDLTNKEAILTKEITIYSMGYTNTIDVGSVIYTDGELVNYLDDTDSYTLDGSKLITNDVNITYTPLLRDVDLEEVYYIYYTINDLFVDIEKVDYKDITKTLTNLNSLVNGIYKIDINVVDKLNNVLINKTLNFSVYDSAKVLTKEDFSEDNISLMTVLSYNNLTSEEKSLLELTEVELNRIEELVNYYSKESYVDRNISSIISLNDYYASSFYEIDGDKEKVFISSGTINNINSIDNRINTMMLQQLFGNDNVIVYAYDENLNKLGSDVYLKTNMTLEFYVNGIKNNYKVVLLGNLSSDDGYINHDDIINIIDIAINSTRLDGIYKLASDVNKDNEINILDTTNLMNLLKNGTYNYEDSKIISNIKAILNPDKTEVRVGDTFELTLGLKNFNGNKISGLEGIINYDKSLIECVSVLNINDWYGNINVINEDGYGKFLTSGYTILDSETTILTYTFKALKEGNATVYIDNIKAALNGVEVLFDDSETNTVSVTIDRALYTNNNLSSISTDIGNFDKAFDKDILRYTLYVDYRTTKVNLSGVVENEYATTSAFKEYTLSGYKTTIEIPVTAEDGSVKTYIVDVIKVDNRSVNNYLSDLKIDGANIEFDKNTYEYDITVENNITELTVLATAEDSKSEITITGNNDLKVGENTIEVTVEAENGSTRVYKVNVTRKNIETINDVDEGEENNNSKLILIILIIATLSALIYLIFKDNSSDDNENKEFKLKDKPYNKKQ